MEWEAVLAEEFRVAQGLVIEAEKQGAKQERERILKAIEDAPPAMDFFGPYISKEKLYEVIKGEN